MNDKKYEAATNIIVHLNFLNKFDLQTLCIDLAQSKQTNLIKKILDKEPGLINTVIKALSTRDNVKTASKLVKDFKLNPSDFPEMQEIQHNSAVNYYVSQVFRSPDHPQHTPLHKVEDLFSERPRMLISLVESLLKKKMAVQAKGIYIRNNLAAHASDKLKEQMEALPYNLKFD